MEGFQTNLGTTLTSDINKIDTLTKAMRTDFNKYIALVPQRQNLLDGQTPIKTDIDAKNILLKDLNRVEETLDRQYLDLREQGLPKPMNIQDWSLIFFFGMYAALCIIVGISLIRMSTQKLRLGSFLFGISITIGLLFFVLIRTFG